MNSLHNFRGGGVPDLGTTNTFCASDIHMMKGGILV